MSEDTQAHEGGFFSWILAFLFGRDAGSPQGKELRQMNRDLAHAGYKFYNYPRDRMQPAFLGFLFSVYRVVAPLREFFLLRNEDAYYQSLVFQYSLSDEQRARMEQLTPQSMGAASEKESAKDLSERCRQEFEAFRAEFTSEKVADVNSLYYGVRLLKQFCVLDYYPVLRSGCAQLKENDFSRVPKFSYVYRRTVQEFLEDFLAFAAALSNVLDWKPVFAFLRGAPGIREAVDYLALEKLLLSLCEMTDKSVLLRLARLVHTDVSYEFPAWRGQKDIVLPHVEQVYQDFRTALADIVREHQSSQVVTLVSHLFSAKEIVPLKFYNEEASLVYEKKGFEGYAYCTALMYVGLFCSKYLHGEISDFMGIFEANASSPSMNFIQSCSKLYNDLLELHKEVLKLDQQLDVKFSEGYQLKMLFDATAADEKKAVQFSNALDDINAHAESIIKRMQTLLRQLGGKFNDLQLDAGTVSPRLVTNWPEIQRYMRGDAIDMLRSHICPHVQDFLQLLENYRDL